MEHLLGTRAHIGFWGFGGVFWQYWSVSPGLHACLALPGSHFSHTPSTFCFSLFFREGLTLLPRLALSLNLLSPSPE
jgi:hypothetical protein